MSLDTLRTALVALISDPNDSAAWSQIEEAVAEGEGDAVVRELERSRLELEKQRSWVAATKLLEFELKVVQGDAQVASKQLQRARIFHEELYRDDDALVAYRSALDARPDDASAKAAIADILAQRETWEATVEQLMLDATEADDDGRRARFLVAAADTTLRHAPRIETNVKRVADFLERALAGDGDNRRARALAAVVYEELERWDDAARALGRLADVLPTRADKIATAAHAAQIHRTRLDDAEGSIRAHEKVIELEPGNAIAVDWLREHYTQNESWQPLVAVYERMLSSGTVKQAEEFAIWVQIAMLHWQALGNPEAAEPYFEKVRKGEPAHLGMLRFFRERYSSKGDAGRLIAVLTDAQRASTDDEWKRKLTDEIAALAESQDNSKRAIDQYKAALRTDPNDEDAREKLKKLYLQTEAYHALVDLLRQDLQRLPKEDAAGRIAVLRQMAELYRDRMKSDTALLTVLTQILQIDERDVEAVRDVIKVYETLSRWRDLLGAQQKLADITADPSERIELLRAVARRWLEQFSNVQNAIAAYEALLESTGDDAEAREQLVDLYQKRRTWPKLYELYEKQLEAATGDERIRILREMAKLAAERLDKGEESIRLWKTILEEAPEAEGVLDALEKQAERQKDFATSAFVLEARIAESDAEKKVVLLQKLGAFQAEKMNDFPASLRTWRRVLDLSPGHTRALRVLRQALVEARDWDGLEELYGSQDDYEGLADFLSTTADRTEAQPDKVALSFRAARIYESQLSAPERAARSFERVLAAQPKNIDAARALLPIYEADSKWSRLPGLHGILLEATSDVDEKIAILEKMASIAGGQLANKNAALQYARQAYELRRDEAGLERLREWSQLSGDWSSFVEVLKAKLGEAGLSIAASREVEAKLADVYATHLGKTDDAVAIYRKLVDADPADTETVATFEQLLRSNARKEDLRWLFEIKASRFQGYAQIEALEEWAQVEQDVFGEPERAVDLLERVFALDASRTGSLAELTRLLAAAGKFKRAAEVMQAHRDAEVGDARVRLETALAALYLERLDAPVEAFDACVRALEIDAEYGRAIALLETLAGPLPKGLEPKPGAVRARAASVLEEYHGRKGNAGDRARVLRVLLEHEDQADRRLELFRSLAEALETELEDRGAALDVVLSALAEAPAELSLWDSASRLAGLSGRTKDLANAYARTVGEGAKRAPELERDLRIDLCDRAATLHEEHLSDPEGAAPYLQVVLDLDPKHDGAFSRLKAILTGAERWSDLEGLYLRAIETAEDDLTKVEHLHQVALLAEELMSDDGRAIGYFERIAGLDPLHSEATESLDRLYVRNERFTELAALLERSLETASEEDAVTLRIRLVDLYLHALKQTARVMAHLSAVLEGHHDHSEARELAEECLAVEELRQPAALLLDGVYDARGEIRDLVRILGVRLEAELSDDDRRELLRRVATLRDERLRDDPGAFAALRRLVPLEPEDASVRERFLQIGQRTGSYAEVADGLTEAAKRCQSAQARGEILMAAAQVCERDLEDDVRAEGLLKEALEIDPADPELVIPAARALAAIYAKRGDHANLVVVLGIEVKLVDEADERARLFERIATLYEEALSDRANAIVSWNARLADEPTDLVALLSLERLYGDSEEWRNLIDALRRIEQATDHPQERKRCMVKCAEVLGDRLDEVADAIAAWRAVQDDFGPEPLVLDPLARLQEKAGRFEELAEVLETWITLAADATDLQVRLGDVRRARLADPSGAMASYRTVLERDPTNAPARAGLESLLGHEVAEVRREAAQTLAPIFRADGNAEALLRVLDIEVAATEEPSERLEILERALNTAEDVLDDSSRAFDYAARGVREAAGEMNLAHWIANAERLADNTKRHADLLELFEAVLGQILDSEVQQSTRLRAAELARAQLGDDRRAIGHYRAALDAVSDDATALLALEELYAAVADDAALLGILVQRAEQAQDDARVALLLRAGALQAGPLSDKGAAIRTYEDVLEIILDPEAVAALDGLYRTEQKFDSLVSLFERQIDSAKGKAIADLRVKLTAVLVTHQKDLARALDELDAALELEPLHSGAVEALEALLETVTDSEQKAHVARALEPVYRTTANWERLKVALEARVDTCDDPGERGLLLQKLAQHYEEQLEDYGMALETVARLLREEPSDERIWDKIESLGRLIGTGAEERVAEIFDSALAGVSSDDGKTAQLSERTGELFAMAGRNVDALSWYRRAFEFSPESEPLFVAIDSLLVALERKEERVAHYLRGVDSAVEPEKRVAYYHVIASLQRDLGRDDDAMSALRDLLDFAPEDDAALDTLTELYKAAGKHDDLAELYERRAEMHHAPEAAAVYRLELARLFAGRPADRDRALEQLQLIVESLPDHSEAVAELEKMLDDASRKETVVDILRGLHERNDDWQSLIALSEHRLALADNPLDQAAIHVETARLVEKRGGDAAAAFEIVLRAFDLVPDSEEILAELERLAEATSAWEKVASAYEAAAARLDEALIKASLLSSVANICDQRLDDPRRSLAALAQVSTLDPADEAAVARMDELCVLLGDWDTLTRVLAARAELVDHVDEKAQIFERLGEVHQDMLGDEESAIVVLEKAVDLDNQSLFAFDRLIWLYGSRDQGRLVALVEQRIDATTDDDDRRLELSIYAAEIYERELERPSDAIRMFELARDILHTDPGVLAGLERLYRGAERWNDLLDNLTTQADLADELSERAALRNRLGDLCLQAFAQTTDALEHYRAVIEEVPEDGHALKALHQLARDHEDLRFEITVLLEPIYASMGRFWELIDLLELRVTAHHESVERATTLIQIALIQEEQLDALDRARDSRLRALVEIHADGATADESHHEEIERLCEATGDFVAYADTLQKLGPEVYDATTQSELYARLARIAESQLEDKPRAIEAYRKAADQADEPGVYLEALDRLYSETSDFERLAAVLERRLESEGDAGAMAELHHRLGDVRHGHFRDARGAIEQYERALEVDPEHAGARARLEELSGDPALFDTVAEVLDGLYRRLGDGDARVNLRNKRIDFTESATERLRLRLDLAQMLEDEGADPDAAQRIVEYALPDGPTDEELLERLERLAGLNGSGEAGAEAWRRAGEAVMNAIEATRGSEGSAGVRPDIARDVYLRIATWFEDNVEDPSHAERALAAALAEDPTAGEALVRLEALQRAYGRDRDLVETLRKLADLVDSGAASTDREASDLRREAKALAEESLADASLTEAILRDMLKAYDSDDWALAELSLVCAAKADHAERFTLMKRRLELASESDVLRVLRHETALVAEDDLDDAASAIVLLEQAFDDDSSDAAAAAALRRLYLKDGRHEDLLRLLERLVDCEENLEHRAELRMEAATISQIELGAPSEAIGQLQAILEEIPGHIGAVELLSELLEKTGRDEELVELLERQVDVAREQGDPDGELSLRLRLAEICDTRLGDANRAIDGNLAVLDLDPSYRPAREALARLYEKQGRTSDAAETLERLLDGAPLADVTRLALRARDLYESDEAAGVRVLEGAAATPDLSAADLKSIREALEALYLKLERLEALADLVARRADEGEDDAERVLLYRRAAGIQAAKRQDHVAAAGLLERALELQSDNRDIMLELADSFTAAGIPDEAIGMLQKVVEAFGGKRSKDLAEIHLRLASAQQARGDVGAALAELEAARRLDPSNLKVSADLGELSLDLYETTTDEEAKAEHLRRADGAFKALLLQRLDDAGAVRKAAVFFGMARVLVAMNDPKKAIHNLERALAAEPDLAVADELLTKLKASE
ncbi:MAG: tetratricopeptide repeat protein [Deltaproteobacteria bacterium]|nr:tetratricopeptide repeat protein [Deltaproteobacteria bacterium]